MEKYRNSNDKVGAAFSPGYGAGWSTWNKKEYEERLVFDPIIIDMIITNRHKNIPAYVKEISPDLYSGGHDQLEVEWLSPGTRFEITEYDGFETIEILDQKVYLQA